ncbi:MAG: GTP-binding protein [Candidatus Tectomicrobia bacterium]|nr:GTP-binding protein [Candidatus Tectomicrobia bacterium]
MNIRNLAIISHVDHGKTTLIDGLFRNAGLFEGHKILAERVMDSGELEKERGITITAKNASFVWKEVQVNIVDTPGHSDFGGEVERALHMVDGALLLVDAAEGPLPQTRFVLQKALEKGIKIICVINKVDRSDARIAEVEEQLLELFYDVAVNSQQLSYTTLYASAKEGWASLHKDVRKTDFSDLLDHIIQEIPPPNVNPSAPFQMLVTNLKYSPYVGQIAVGRIESGSVTMNQRLVLLGENGKSSGFNVTSLETFSGLGTAHFEELRAGTVALIAGVTDPRIGDTITTAEYNQALPRIKVDPPTVAVRISINTSPLAGRDGKYATSRKVYELLQTACLENVALQLDVANGANVFLLKARGELALVILIEQLRRQGWEFMVGRPEIIPVELDGQKMEPEEILTIDIPDTLVGIVTPLLASRGGRMENMKPLEGSSRVRMKFVIPARGLIGLRSQMLTETWGQAIYSSSFKGYIPYQGKRFSRINGALIADRAGQTTDYALFNLQPRGRLFLGSGVDVYEGMVFGEHNKDTNLNCNAVVAKKLTNMRSAGKDDSTKLKGRPGLGLEEALEWIDEDEWVEVTPLTVRIRKHELRSNFRKVTRK